MLKDGLELPSARAHSTAHPTAYGLFTYLKLAVECWVCQLQLEAGIYAVQLYIRGVGRTSLANNHHVSEETRACFCHCLLAIFSV